MTLCAYNVDYDDVLDLTDTAIACNVAPSDLSCPWKDLATRNGTPACWANG